MKKGLVVIDYQYDFVSPSGSLYVKGAEQIQNNLKKYILDKKNEGYLIIFTRDWHPKNHASFDIWPPHCIQNTEGSKLMIDEGNADLIINKGIHISYDSYSGFYEAPGIETVLNNFLRENNIKDLELCGVALDVCVKATYDDAIKFGYNTNVILELTKAIDENYLWKE